MGRERERGWVESIEWERENDSLPLRKDVVGDGRWEERRALSLT